MATKVANITGNNVKLHICQMQVLWGMGGSSPVPGSLEVSYARAGQGKDYLSSKEGTALSWPTNGGANSEGSL